MRKIKWLHSACLLLVCLTLSGAVWSGTNFEKCIQKEVIKKCTSDTQCAQDALKSCEKERPPSRYKIDEYQCDDLCGKEYMTCIDKYPQSGCAIQFQVCGHNCELLGTHLINGNYDDE